MSILSRIKSNRWVSKAAFGVGSLALVGIIGFSTAAAQNNTVTTSGTGYGTTTITNNNTVTITNNNSQTATSGDVTVSGNTQGGNATSGNATNTSTASFTVSIQN